jgi:hypothetical protein
MISLRGRCGQRLSGRGKIVDEAINDLYRGGSACGPGERGRGRNCKPNGTSFAR